MKQFKVSKSSLLFTYFTLAAFILVVLFMSPVVYTGDDTGGKIFFFFWSIVVLVMVVWTLKMPLSIELNSDLQRIIFNSIFSKKEIETLKIRRVDTTPINSAFITFRHESGKVVLLNRIDGLHELISEIKRVNDNIATRGC
jgi:hypothetical protein